MGNKFDEIFYNVKKNPRNVFSTTSGLKGYKVGKKKFPATLRGYAAAKQCQSDLWDKTKKPVSMKYLY